MPVRVVAPQFRRVPLVLISPVTLPLPLRDVLRPWTADAASHIEGFEAGLKHLPPETREAARRWCQETDTASMHLVVELNLMDAFIGALGVKEGGNNEQAVRQRLAALAE